MYVAPRQSATTIKPQLALARVFCRRHPRERAHVGGHQNQTPICMQDEYDAFVGFSSMDTVNGSDGGKCRLIAMTRVLLQSGS